MFITDMAQNKYEANKYGEPIIYKYELEEIRRLYHMYENSEVPVSELHIKFNHLRFNFVYIDCFTNVKDMCGFYDIDYRGPVMYIDTISEYEQWPGETSREDYGFRSDFTQPVIIDKGKLWYTEYWENVNADDPWTEEDEEKWTERKSWDSFDEWIDYIEKSLAEDKILKD